MTIQRKLLEVIHDQLRLDPKWTKWSKDSFTWWSLKNVKQTILADKPYDYNQSKIIRIYVETELYQNTVEISKNELTKPSNSLECLYWDHKKKSLIQINAHNVSQNNANWMIGLIIATSSIQMSLSRWLYLLNDNDSSHNQEKNEDVQNNEVPDQHPFVIPISDVSDLSKVKSRLKEEFFESCNTFNMMNSFSNCSDESITIEFPYSKTDTSILTCKIDNLEHRGYGISFRLIVPYKLNHKDPISFCNELNLEEIRSSKYTDIIGNWMYSEKFDYPEHYTFLPLYLYDYGLIHYFNTNLGLKAKWLCDKLGDGDNSALPVDISISRLKNFNDDFQIRKS